MIDTTTNSKKARHYEPIERRRSNRRDEKVDRRQGLRIESVDSDRRQRQDRRKPKTN